MRENKDINDHFIIEEHTVNKNNIMKIQNAFKDLEFSNENEEEVTNDKEGQVDIENVGRSSKRYSLKEEGDEETVNTFKKTKLHWNIHLRI